MYSRAMIVSRAMSLVLQTKPSVICIVERLGDIIAKFVSRVDTMTRQHTIPQFYLRPFLSPGWVYQKGASAPKQKRSPRNVAMQPDYYGEDEVADKTLDDLNRWIESWGAPVFRKLIEDPRAIIESEWVILSYLFANFAVRMPVAIEGLRAMELNWTHEVNKIARRTGSSQFKFISRKLGEESPPTTLDQINDYATRLRAEGGHRVAANDTFGLLRDTAERINQMSFLALEAPSGLFFVSSDRPLAIESSQSGVPVGAGWGNPDAVGMIALHPSRFLLMYYQDEPSYMQILATANQVELLNLKTINFAYQEIYSCFKYAEADDWMKGLGCWSTREQDCC